MISFFFFFFCLVPLLIMAREPQGQLVWGHCYNYSLVAQALIIPQSISDFWTCVLSPCQYWTSDNSFLTSFGVCTLGLTPAPKTARNTLNVNYCTYVCRISQVSFKYMQVWAGCTEMIPYKSNTNIHTCIHSIFFKYTQLKVATTSISSCTRCHYKRGNNLSSLLYSCPFKRTFWVQEEHLTALSLDGVLLLPDSLLHRNISG